MNVGGTADAAGFGRVVDAFRENFAIREEAGAALAVYRHGEPVVDIWGGEAAPGRSWDADTMATVFSTTKGVTAVIAHVLADQGLLDVEAVVAEYWPEFGASGKHDVTVAGVLSHRAGVLSVPDYHRLTNDPYPSWDEIVTEIADAAPYWDPGTQHGYHAITYGWIIGEVVRRITGRTIGTYFREAIAQPLDLDFWIGLPAGEHHRVADLIDAPPVDDPLIAGYLSLFRPDTWTGQAHFVGPSGVTSVAERFNSPAVRSMELPASGGIGTARSLAKLFGALANAGEIDGHRVVSADSIAEHTRPRSEGHDRVLLIENAFGLGYSLPNELNAYGFIPTAFGHSGLGGSVVFADPDAGIGFGYVPNQLRFPGLTEKSRGRALAEAVYASL